MHCNSSREWIVVEVEIYICVFMMGVCIYDGCVYEVRFILT